MHGVLCVWEIRVNPEPINDWKAELKALVENGSANGTFRDGKVRVSFRVRCLGARVRT
jgi:hypothetical protein